MRQITRTRVILFVCAVLALGLLPGEAVADEAGTGAAGFLQGLLYGPTGLRWTETGPHLDPMLPSGFPDGMTIRDIAIRGSRLTVQIQPATTTVSLISGPTTTIDTPNGPQTITPGTPLHLATRRDCS
jgi:hypothetical protein